MRWGANPDVVNVKGVTPTQMMLQTTPGRQRALRKWKIKWQRSVFEEVVTCPASVWSHLPRDIHSKIVKLVN